MGDHDSFLCHTKLYVSYYTHKLSNILKWSNMALLGVFLDADMYYADHDKGHCELAAF